MIRGVRRWVVISALVLLPACSGGPSMVTIRGTFSDVRFAAPSIGDCSTALRGSAADRGLTFKNESGKIIGHAVTSHAEHFTSKLIDSIWHCTWSAPYTVTVPHSVFYQASADGGDTAWPPISDATLKVRGYGLDLPPAAPAP